MAVAGLWLSVGYMYKYIQVYSVFRAEMASLFSAQSKIYIEHYQCEVAPVIPIS